MPRVYNFSAGPSCLPLPVLERASAEMLNCGESGQSVMEMSHRTPEFERIINSCEALLRELMHIPENYKVLFLQGGAWTQFAMLPMNLLTASRTADYILTGQWAEKAYKEALKLGSARVVASSADKKYSYIPEIDENKMDRNADYCHICMNNTIFGTRFSKLPQTGEVPLVADISSCILSENIDVSRFGLLYAGAQKNLSCAGLTLVIIREDLLARTPENIPEMLKYTTHANNGSMFNTPPCYAIYIAMLVLEWLKELGGVEAIEKINREKAKLIYSCIDASSVFNANIPREQDRSFMNICFSTGDKEKDAAFVAGAREHGLINLKGHRAVGGIRASVYNAMSVDGAKALVEYMKQYEMENE